MKIISLALVLAVTTSVSARSRELRMMMGRGGKMMGLGGKMMGGKIDTSAEATALYFSGGCDYIPDNEWVDVCVAQDGIPTRLKFGVTIGTMSMSTVTEALIACCEEEFFDIDSIVGSAPSFPRGSGPLCSDGTPTAPNAGVVIGNRVYCLPPAVVGSMM